MPESTKHVEEARSPQQQWQEAAKALQRCLADIHQEAEPASQRKQAITKGKELLEKAHISLPSKTVPGKPVNSFLGLLLLAMQAKFVVDREYRKNIKEFNAQYVFKDRTAEICQVAHFVNGTMRVNDKKPENPTFTLIFRDGKALLALLFSPAPDVLNALLNQEVDFIGNINYLNKFAYMALLARPHF